MTSSLRNTLPVAATTRLYDNANGIFGELIPPEVVLSSLAYDENVGNIGDPAAAQAVTSLHSITYEGKELAVEFNNISSTHKVCIRWMNEHGNNPMTHAWTVDPSSTFVQYTRPGHLFLLTAQVGQEEVILGAYRPLRPFPSGSPHCVLIKQQDVADAFLLELFLADIEDSLMVAASALDPAGFADKKTVPMLNAIVTNLIQRPREEKYRRLRLSNRNIQGHIVSAWGAMHLLQLLGFQLTELAAEESKESEAGAEDFFYLVFPTIPTEAQLAIFQRAKEMLELLITRADPHFVAELAAPPPWQTPLLSSGGALASHWNSQGTHFITPDQRWQRTERLQARRGGRPRRPSPGNAPSSRGKWGR